MELWIPAIITILVNAAVVTFSYGKLHQSVTDLKERIKMLETQNCNHSMLPECMQEFKEISNKLGELSGKVDILITKIKKEI